MRAILFDTETTGFKDPEIIEAAWIELPEPGDLRGQDADEALARATKHVQRFEPSKAISFGAMAVHHITNGMVHGCPPSADFHLPFGVDFIVGHAIDYDWKAARSPEDVRRICTLAFARSLWPETDSHTLSAMTYFLNGEAAREWCMKAHGALADCEMNLRLLLAILDKLPEVQTWDDFHTECEIARVPKRFTFGKYGPKNGNKGREIAGLSLYDPNYQDWLLSGKCDQVNEDAYLRQAIQRA